MYGVIGNNCNLRIFRIWKILTTPGEKTMHPGKLVIEINVGYAGFIYFPATNSKPARYKVSTLDE